MGRGKSKSSGFVNAANTGLSSKNNQGINANKLNLNYSPDTGESGGKPHSYCVLSEYCFNLLSEWKKASIYGKI